MENVLNKRIVRQHTFAFKIAFIVAVIWTSIDILFKSNYSLTIGFDISIVAITAILYFINRSVKKKRSQILAFAYVFYLVIGSSILQFFLDTNGFSNFVFNQVIVFTGCGMFFYWKWQWSLFFAAFYALSISLGLNIFWDESFVAFLNKGGLLTMTLFALMVISIHLRTSALRRDTEKTIALQESEMRTTQLIESAKDGVIMIDANSEVVLFNPAAEKMFGRSESEILGTPIELLIPDIDVLVKDKSDDGSGKAYILETDYMPKTPLEGERSNGELFPIETSISELTIKDTRHYTAIVRDITVQEETRKQLLEAKKMAEKSKEMQGHFLSNMSHEIRTPMNGVIGLASLLEKTSLNEEQQKYLSAIQKSSENLLVILNDILDFSKIEAGKLTFESIPFNLIDQLESTHQIMCVRANERMLTLNMEIADDVPSEIIGDPFRLNQILINLIGNGLKFTKEGGVCIRVSSKERNAQKVKLRFEIQDTGIGIPEDKMDAVFSSFTQASVSTTRKFGGTGLGLTISKQLVETMGGALTVESTYGEGSTFSFELSFELSADETIDDEQSSGSNMDKKLADLKGLKVLLVEDNDINQLVALSVLEKWGLNADLATNGAEAVKAFQNNPFDVVLMDIHMPEMDGYEATLKIRELEYGSGIHTPIIAMTASALIGDNLKCLQVGMDDYISKPFDPENLLRKIYNCVKKKSKVA